MADKELIERNKHTMKGFFSKSAFDGTLDSRTRGLRIIGLTNEAENFELDDDGLLATTRCLTDIDEKYADGFRHSLSDQNESSQRAYNRAVQESFAIVNGDIEKKRENDYKNAMREGGTKGSFNPETFQKAIDSASTSLSSQKDKLKNMLSFLEASIDDSPDRKALIDQINSMLSSTTPSAQSPDDGINDRIARLEEINLKMFETLQVMSSYNAIMAERLTNGLSAQTRAISEVANLTLENKNESMSIKSILKEMRD
jgi:hypothetical protein